MNLSFDDTDPAGARPGSQHAAPDWPEPDIGGTETDLDECRALKTLTSAVQVLTNTPHHPAADTLVADLQALARACRRRARAIGAKAPAGPAGETANCPKERAELLADKAEQVAQWARMRVLGGDSDVLDRWLARQRQTALQAGREPGLAPAPARHTG
jgi:hypothetical protein